MTWSLRGFLDDAEKALEHDFSSETLMRQVSDREQKIILAAEEVVKNLATVFGGHISISVSGHASPLPTPGDQLAIRLSYVPKPTPVATAAAAPVEPSAQPPVPSQVELPPSVVADAEVVPIDTPAADLPAPQEIVRPAVATAGPTPVFATPAEGWPSPNR